MTQLPTYRTRLGTQIRYVFQTKHYAGGANHWSWPSRPSNLIQSTTQLCIHCSSFLVLCRSRYYRGYNVHAFTLTPACDVHACIAWHHSPGAPSAIRHASTSGPPLVCQSGANAWENPHKQPEDQNFCWDTCSALKYIAFHCRFASTCQEYAQLLGHQNGKLPCLNLHTNDHAMRADTLLLGLGQRNSLAANSRCRRAERRQCTAIVDFAR